MNYRKNSHEADKFMSNVWNRSQVPSITNSSTNVQLMLSKREKNLNLFSKKKYLLSKEGESLAKFWSKMISNPSSECAGAKSKIQSGHYKNCKKVMPRNLLPLDCLKIFGDCCQ